MYDWSHSDLVAAVSSVVFDAERCPGCNLTETDAWWVAADIVSCPTCEDRDRRARSLRDQSSTEGLRIRFTPLTDLEESIMESAAARYTLAGAEARARYLHERRV